MIRVGQGYDVHRLEEGRKLIVGGLEIPFEKGLQGHSDADVLLHAITDSLLGAAALGDIGSHFPDNDEKYKNADSMKLLSLAVKLLHNDSWKIINIDSTIIAQKPKFKPYIERMRQNIADACIMEIENVSVKATTEEGLGFTGSGLGMAARAVSLIKKESD